MVRRRSAVSTYEQPDQVEGPAKRHAGHVQDRILGAGAGAKLGFRNMHEHPLTAAERSGKISEDEFAAGELYRAFYEAMGRTGRDSTDFSAIAGTGGRTPASVAQVHSIRVIEAIENNILAADREYGRQWVAMVRHFCGEGWTATATCHAAQLPNSHIIWSNIRIALNKLATAISKTRVPR